MKDVLMLKNRLRKFYSQKHKFVLNYGSASVLDELLFLSV